MKNIFYKLFRRKRKIPKLDDKVYNLFAGIYNSKQFTVENAYKDFAYLGNNMTNIEKLWYIGMCNSGEECWCRTISTDPNSDDMEDNIAPSGTLTKEIAEYIVKLHNSTVTSNKR